jgi:mono/diheme cytochrome c family protein
MALVGGLPGLLGSDYGRLVLIKTALFVVLLGFAAVNRFILSPALADPLAHDAVKRLRRSIYAEAGLGAVTILAAAWLAGLPPGAHEQPVWPLSWQPAWDALDDPRVVASLEAAFALLAVAAASVLAALRWRSLGRLLVPLCLVCGALGIWLIIPQLSAFAVPAYPSSFFESTTGLTKASVAAGGVIYRAQCAACHGPRGFGDGPLAAGLAVHPAPLTGFHLLARSDGEMFWLLTKGIAAPGGGIAMPGFEATLTEDERWEAIDFVRALAGAEPTDAPTLPHHHH